MSKQINNLTKQERSIINKRANFLKHLAYEAYRMRLSQWAVEHKGKTGQSITGDELAQVVPDISADLK